MTDLHPCAGCARHVGASELTCPFCGHALMRPVPRELPRGRLSRAAVFAGALAAAACGGKAKRADHVEEPHVQNHPCSEPNPAEIERLEKERQQATTEEEQRRLDEEIEEAKQPVCAPYGAPPARRRIV